MTAIELVKKHPVITGVGVLGVIILAVMLSSGGGSEVQTGATGPTDAEIAAGMQTQQIQAAANAQAQEVAAQREVALANLAGNLELGKLTLQYQSGADLVAKEIALAQLAAQVTAGEQQTILQKFLARQDTKRDQIVAHTIRAQGRQTMKISLASIKSMVKIAKINDNSWFDSLFG